jgi:hypothetical protein
MRTDFHPLFPVSYAVFSCWSEYWSNSDKHEKCEGNLKELERKYNWIKSSDHWVKP